MYNIKLFAIIALLVLCNVADGKKIKKNKRPKQEDDYTTLQPNVVAYSTFGFNDVGSYDGFVPTSPDYASFLSGAGHEATTRLYGPAFPSAMESQSFNGNFESAPFTGQSSGAGDEQMGPGMLHYPSNSMNFFNAPNFGTANNQNIDVGSGDLHEHIVEDSDAPVYGTKINSRHKSKPLNQFNYTDFGVFGNNYSNLTNDKYFNSPEEPTHDNNPSFGEPNLNFQNSNNYVSTYATVDDEFEKSIPNMHTVLNFPKVIDFTKNYPAEMDTSKFPDFTKFANIQNTISSAPAENLFLNTNNGKYINSKPSFTDNYDFKNNEDGSDKSAIKQTNSFPEHDYTYNHITSHNKPGPGIKINSDQKNKQKKKPWITGNNSNNFKNWKDSSTLNEYGYSTNFSNMHFKYGSTDIRKPPGSSHDEILPASSNLVDLTNYQTLETDYSKLKKMPESINDEEYPSFSTYQDKPKSTNYFSQFKNSFTTSPTTSSHWGNTFKTSDYSLFRDHAKKPFYNENNNDEVVNIPKRPIKLPKPSEFKHIEWPSANHRPHKTKPLRDWTKDFVDNRYKSEEELLGLRNHDTSHPSYIPTYNPSGNAEESENEFKKLVEKWRQSYLRSKYKDYESYGTEIRPQHVPVAKPYPIEVPHPVIVPVPRPYPVRVPVSRPVLVPVVHEITVPIEKPVPYPVIKNVPYPVEKPVPVPVVKEVAVPVEKPYPVHVPYVRPVFHHTRPVHEDTYENDHAEEEEFVRRPEYKKTPQYKKRPYISRNRSRRPSRTVYQERNRRRWPDRRRPSGQGFEYTRVAKPFGHPQPSRIKYHDTDEDDDRVDYSYCRRTGNC